MILIERDGGGVVLCQELRRGCLVFPVSIHIDWTGIA